MVQPPLFISACAAAAPPPQPPPPQRRKRCKPAALPDIRGHRCCCTQTDFRFQLLLCFFAPAVSLADGKSLTVAFRHSQRQKSRRKQVLTTRCAEHDVTPASPPQHFEAPACAASGGRSTISLAHFHNASSKRICMCHSCFIKVVCFRSKRVVHRPFHVVNHLQRLCPRSHHGAFPRRCPARVAAAHARLESDVCEQVWQGQLALAISVFSQKPVNAESCEG